jgi:parvulin-like peptidyl-prolyl isomerase
LLPPLRGDAEAELRAAAQQATVGQVSGVVVTRQGLQIFQRLR